MVKAVRGMRDILPAHSERWRQVEATVLQTLRSYSYAEVRLPLLEYTELFARGVGEATDIIEKEMYSLADRDGDSLSLRPEGTASCVRALEEHGLLYNRSGGCFMPAQCFVTKSRKRSLPQFSQIGAEAYGFAGPDVDAELIALGYACWQQLGITDRVHLQQHFGIRCCSCGVSAGVIGLFATPCRSLDLDSQRRLQTNPLRILDSKVAATQAIVKDAQLITSSMPKV